MAAAIVDTVAGPLNASPLDMWAKLQTALEEALTTQRARATSLLAGMFRAPTHGQFIYGPHQGIPVRMPRSQGLSSTARRRQPSTPVSTTRPRPRCATASRTRPPRPPFSPSCSAGTPSPSHLFVPPLRPDPPAPHPVLFPVAAFFAGLTKCSSTTTRVGRGSGRRTTTSTASTTAHASAPRPRWACTSVPPWIPPPWYGDAARRSPVRQRA